MPTVTLPPLPPHLEAIRQRIASLPEAERKTLASRLLKDRMRANDKRHNEYAQAFERQRSRKR